MSVNVTLKLRSAGFDDQQIEALVALVSGEAATKVDLVETRAELANRIDRLDAKLVAEVARLSGEIKALETRLSGEIKALEAKLDGKLQLLQWMLGIAITLMIAVALKTFFG